MAVVDDPHQSQKRGRTRSPAYPYIALPNALEKAAVLWQVEGRHAAAVNVAMQHWGYKEDSSTGYSCVAALKKFGLVDHEGMGDTRQVKLSDLALTILLDKDPDSDERRGALRTAALGPRIHTELWERYGTELPSDQSLKRFLVLERAFNEASVDEFLDEYKQTMTFAGLNVGTGAAGAAPPAQAVSAGPGGAGAAVTRAPVPASPGPGGTKDGFRETGGRTDGLSSTDRRPLEGSSNASRAPQRPQTARDEHRQDATPFHSPGSFPADRGIAAAAQRQRDLFSEDERAAPPDPGAAAPLVRPARTEPAPWSMARKELPVPLDNDLVARVPYPMSEEDFELLIGTLQLWKKRLVQPDLRAGG